MADWSCDSERLLEVFGERRGICALWTCDERHAPLQTVYVKAPWVSWWFEILFDPGKETWTLTIRQDHTKTIHIDIAAEQDVVDVVLGEWRSCEAR